MNSSTVQLRYALLFFSALAGCGWLYWAGLQGGLIFDDYSNLGDLDSIKTAQDWYKFVGQGIAGELGRPISLLSFALQVDAWQAGDIWAFKYVNLLLHLLTGCLLFLLLLQLTKYLGLTEEQSLLFAFLTSTLWLIHPLNVSTTLYVVQRMTQLSALFTVLGLVVYLYGRQYLTVAKYKSLVLMSIGIGGGGILALLSKENGILILFYVLALEFTILSATPRTRMWQIWASFFLYLPIFLFLGYIGSKFGSFLNIYAIRDFNLTERLLTQSHVLVDYISKILLINTNPFGLFQDDFPLSRSLLTPPLTLITVVFILGLLGTALLLHKRFTIITGGILWFFSGHLLESSIIPLVIYFEHRNYLAMVGILWGFVYGIVWVVQRVQKPLFRYLISGLVLLWIGIMGLKTAVEVDIWSNTAKQAIVWAKERPHSYYAQSQAASALATLGEFAKAQTYHQQMINNNPDDTSAYLLWLAFRCFSDQVQEPDMPLLLEKTRTGRVTNGSLEGINTIAGWHKQNKCSIVPLATVNLILQNLIDNPNSYIHLKDIYAIYSDLLVFEKNIPLAVDLANKSLALEYDAQLHLNMIRWLATAQRYQDVLTQTQLMRNKLTFANRALFIQDLNILESLAHKALLVQNPNITGKEDDKP
ncbi:hypothetical protein [Beggiatoa leptomitoformis]|uniref:Tetratricopeptide repeat protein n=1 Tax=Beggiatoa leptomitoformis TaxID=288004 RepID=A0A2N9YAP8_9GAMM|nr:hypothetical protein [Beggiatoa leptomitoformis]ALG67069.1 hypothetical protein AL038_04245 [Beggiatoa leptomitoformis]AUI67543.1 hypothetical protein BLE401_01760 [Beggiatoa leptomitoformis]